MTKNSVAQIGVSFVATRWHLLAVSAGTSLMSFRKVVKPVRFKLAPGLLELGKSMCAGSSETSMSHKWIRSCLYLLSYLTNLHQNLLVETRI